MLYLIDSANKSQIEEVSSYGVNGITTPTSMYRKEQIRIEDFLNRYSNTNISFLSVEVIGTYDEMLAQAK